MEFIWRECFHEADEEVVDSFKPFYTENLIKLLEYASQFGDEIWNPLEIDSPEVLPTTYKDNYVIEDDKTAHLIVHDIVCNDITIYERIDAHKYLVECAGTVEVIAENEEEAEIKAARLFTKDDIENFYAREVD